VDSKRDHPTVVEVLSAFVREQSSAQHENLILPNASANSANETPQLESETDAGKIRPRPGPTVDIQAAVTILGRLPHRDGINRGDLTFANLAGADLHEADLSEAILTGANLMRANLGKADLALAKLHSSNLRGPT
jgi:uncharacterized protein YjbI with pentapeptide repeats